VINDQRRSTRKTEQGRHVAMVATITTTHKLKTELKLSELTLPYHYHNNLYANAMYIYTYIYIYIYACYLLPVACWSSLSGPASAEKSAWLCLCSPTPYVIIRPCIRVTCLYTTYVLPYLPGATWRPLQRRVIGSARRGSPADSGWRLAASFSQPNHHQ